MIDAEDELDLALNPDANVGVPDLEVPAPETVPSLEDGSPVAPSSAAAFDPEFMPPPEYGPPVPPDLAQASTGPSRAPAGPNEVWPPPVPAEAPGNVAPGTPAQPALHAAGGRQEIEDELAARDAARAESDQARTDQYIAQRAADVEKADLITQRRDEIEKQVAADEARIKSEQAADAKAASTVADADQKIRGFKFKDLWADKTTGQKAMMVLSRALLAIGAGMMKTPQYAMQILDNELKQEHQKQLDILGGLKDDYIRAYTGMRDGRAKMAADIHLADARRKDLIAARFEEGAARAKNATAATDAAAFAAKLKQESAEARLTAGTMLRNMYLKDEEAELTRKLKESQITANLARAHLSDRGLGQGRKAAKGGGGGGSSGSAAYDKFVAAASALKPGDPITPEIASLGRQAGLKVNQVSTEIDRIRNSGAKSGYVGTRNEFLAEKMRNLEGSLDVIDAEGNPLGKAPDAKTADRMRKQVQAFDQFKVRMTALRDYIKEHGDRAWSVDDAQQRDSLGAAAAAAGRVYNGLGATDASQRLETMINGAIGTPGHGWWAGANLKVLNHVIDEANHQHQTRLNTSLRPGSPGAKPHEGGGESKIPPGTPSATNAKGEKVYYINGKWGPA